VQGQVEVEAKDCAEAARTEKKNEEKRTVRMKRRRMVGRANVSRIPS